MADKYDMNKVRCNSSVDNGNSLLTPASSSSSGEGGCEGGGGVAGGETGSIHSAFSNSGTVLFRI